MLIISEFWISQELLFLCSRASPDDVGVKPPPVAEGGPATMHACGFGNDEMFLKDQFNDAIILSKDTSELATEL